MEIDFMRPYLCTKVQGQGEKMTISIARSQVGGQDKNNRVQKLAVTDYVMVFKNIYVL